jgi:hypothetical protein
MSRPIKVLLQTTIPTTDDDWHVGRFSLLCEHLRQLKGGIGHSLCFVTARDRNSHTGDDEVLSQLDTTDFDQLWLFAVDIGNGLTVADCQGITRFRQRGGGILTTRDHQDLGSSLCTLGGVGPAHFFHSKQQEPDETRHARDDRDAREISWPNYHSGRNGDYQSIVAVPPIHELMFRPASRHGIVEYFPSHPHEGAVGVPEGESHARVVARGVSQITKRPFNLVVAFESSRDRHGNMLGRAIAESSFHHFADYNWDITKGCPSFVTEPPGEQVKAEPARLDDVKTYIRNAALWLAGRSPVANGQH